MNSTKSINYIRVGQSSRDIFFVSVFYAIIGGALLVLTSGHYVWFVVWSFYFVSFFISLAQYSHIKRRLIINDIGVIILVKKKDRVTRDVYSWNRIQQICYYANLYGKAKYESLSITMFEYSFRKKMTNVKEIDLSHFFPVKIEFRHSVHKELDSVLMNICRLHNVSYEMRSIK